MGPEQPADGGDADADADLAKLTLDPHVTPARVLPGESQDGLTKLRVDRRATDPDGPERPLSPNQLAVPPEQGLRRDHEGGPSIPWQQTSRRCEEHSVEWTKRRTSVLSAQNPELMAKDRDFHVSPRRPTAIQARPRGGVGASGTGSTAPWGGDATCPVRKANRSSGIPHPRVKHDDRLEGVDGHLQESSDLPNTSPVGRAALLVPVRACGESIDAQDHGV
jgi:hypothetical protein